jgi:hypothetical protein
MSIAYHLAKIQFHVHCRYLLSKRLIVSGSIHPKDELFYLHFQKRLFFRLARIPQIKYPDIVVLEFFKNKKQNFYQIIMGKKIVVSYKF